MNPPQKEIRQGAKATLLPKVGKIEYNLNELKRSCFSGSCNFVQEDGESPDFCRDDGKGRDYEAKNWNDESCLQHDPSRTTH